MIKPRPATTPADGKRSKLSQDVYRRLKQGIFDFKLPPGERYSEAFLAETLAVSRTPLRLALHILEHEGYLRNVGGHNCWQITPLDLSYYEDLYDFRTELEVLAVRLADGLYPAPALAALSRFWQVDDTARCYDQDCVAGQDERFHLTIVGFSNNNAMLRAFQDLTDKIRIIRRLDFTTKRRIDEAYDEHLEIITSFGLGNAENTQRLLRDHIARSRSEIRTITLYNLGASKSVAGDI